jgi:hypothetical protein
MKSQLAFSALLVAICSCGAWMLAADRSATAVNNGHLTEERQLERIARESLITGDTGSLMRVIAPSDRLRLREMFDRVQRLRQRGDAEVREFAEQSFIDTVTQLRSRAIEDSATLAMDTSATARHY